MRARSVKHFVCLGISVNYLSVISPFCLLIYMCTYVRYVMCKYIFIVELISLYIFFNIQNLILLIPMLIEWTTLAGTYFS